MPDTPYFTDDEFKARYPDDDTIQGLDADRISAARVLAEEIIEGLETEDGTHVAWVPRTETFTVAGGCDVLNIPRYFLRSVQAITIQGDDQDIDDLWVDESAIRGGWWPRGPVAVTVTHGKDAPPARIKDAAMILAYNRVVNGPIDDRATGRLSPEGSVITLATPGLRGSVTGIPEVDATISQYRKPRIRPLSISLSDSLRYRDSHFLDHLDFG